MWSKLRSISVKSVRFQSVVSSISLRSISPDASCPSHPHLLCLHLRVLLHMDMIVRLEDVHFVGGKVNPAFWSVDEYLQREDCPCVRGRT